MKGKALTASVISLSFLALSAATRAQVLFFQPPNYAGLGAPFVADFNGDGKLDILTSAGTMNLGNGNGTFQPGTAAVSVGASSGPILAVADFNGDGKPDVLQQGTGTLLVLLGNGDGTFQAPISTASGANLSVVAAGNVNGDGKQDVVGIYNNSLFVYISKGDGSFAPGVSYNPGVSPLENAVLMLADLNGDGKTDIVASVSDGTIGGEEVVVFLGNGDGTFQSPKMSPGVGFPEYAVAGDFNGDGKVDLVLAGSVPCAVNCSTLPEEVFLLLGNGDGTFQTPTATAILADGGPLAAADVNGDGKLDLVSEGFEAVPGNNSEAGLAVYLGNGDGTFRDASSYALSFPNYILFPDSSLGFAIGDFNRDGKLDLVGDGAVLLGNGDGTFQGVALSIPPTGSSYSSYIAIGKFDNNSAPGVATIGTQNGGQSVFVLSNNGTGALSLAHSYSIPAPASSVAGADFNLDGNLDLIVISGTNDWSYSVLLGNGDGSFQPPVSSQQFTGAHSGISFPAVVADLNGDKKPDVVVSPILAVLIGNGDGTFAAPVSYFPGGSGVVGPPLVADFNGDGKLDIAVAETVSNVSAGTAFLYGNGDGTFQAAIFPASLSGFSPSFTADINNDGKADLIGGGQVALGNGDGTFTLLSLAAPPNSHFEVAGIGDVNGDGKLDLMVSVHNPPPDEDRAECGVLLGNGDGTFGPLIDVPACGLLADMNNDGRPDLVADLVMGISVLLNTTPAIAPDFSIGAASGSPSSQTVSAGQMASFGLSLAGSGTFSGTVKLSCAITPAETLGPTCSLSNSSIEISGNTLQSVTLKVATTASSTTSTISPIGIPPGSLPWAWTLVYATMLVAFSGLALQSRKRAPVLLAPVLMLVMLSWVSCGGSGSTSSSHTTQGTPAGTYMATVTATSGSLTHTTVSTMIVQ